MEKVALYHGLQYYVPSNLDSGEWYMAHYVGSLNESHFFATSERSSLATVKTDWRGVTGEFWHRVHREWKLGQLNHGEDSMGDIQDWNVYPAETLPPELIAQVIEQHRQA